jgi:hypothetical protein
MIIFYEIIQNCYIIRFYYGTAFYNCRVRAREAFFIMTIFICFR